MNIDSLGAIRLDPGELDEFESKLRAMREGANTNVSADDIDALPLTDSQKRCVIEFLAHKVLDIVEGKTRAVRSMHCKSYDPMIVRDSECHSYVFDLWDGRRHHEYESYGQIVDALVCEAIERIWGIK